MKNNVKMENNFSNYSDEEGKQRFLNRCKKKL